MKAKWIVVFFAATVLLIVPLSGQAANRSPVAVPAGTTVSPIVYGDEDTNAVLKAEEQVAFLFLYSIFRNEEACFNKDNGLGHLVPLEELLKGVELPGGRTVGLSENPARDTNYRYDVIVVGADCMIRAFPLVPGLGGFALAGSFSKFSSKCTMYYNPKGADLLQAYKMTGYGYSGSGFRR